MKEQKPAVSIIVPVYRVEAYLQKCVDSILHQTLQDWELILVDDGSPDNCPAICDENARRDARIRVIHQKNAGLSAARNAGLDAARGDWVGFVDSDDWIAPEMYETMLRRVQQDGSQLAVCNYLFVAEDGTILPKESSITQDAVLNRVQALEHIQRGYFTIAVNRLYQRSQFDAVRFPVGKLHEDEYVAHRIYDQCEKVSVVAQPLYYYLQRDGGISKQRPSIRRCLDKAEGVLSRAQFGWEQRLDSVAFSACVGAVCALADAWALKDGTPEEKQRLTALTAQAQALARQLLQVPGPRGEKIKLRLFLRSPRLLNVVLGLSGTLRTARTKKTGSLS